MADEGDFEMEKVGKSWITIWPIAIGHISMRHSWLLESFGQQNSLTKFQSIDQLMLRFNLFSIAAYWKNYCWGSISSLVGSDFWLHPVSLSTICRCQLTYNQLYHPHIFITFQFFSIVTDMVLQWSAWRYGRKQCSLQTLSSARLAERILVQFSSGFILMCKGTGTTIGSTTSVSWMRYFSFNFNP